MTFTAYIKRQKEMIRSRHEGETFLVQRGEVIALDETEKLLNDLSSLKGLNKSERMSFKRVV